MKKIIALLCLSASSYAMAYDGLPKLYQTETDALLHKNSTEIFGLVPYDDNYVMMTESNGNFAIISFISFSFISDLIFMISFLLLTWGFFVLLSLIALGARLGCLFKMFPVS